MPEPTKDWAPGGWKRIDPQTLIPKRRRHKQIRWSDVPKPPAPPASSQATAYGNGLLRGLWLAIREVGRG